MLTTQIRFVFTGQGDGGVGSDTFANYLSSQMSGDLKFSSSSDDEDDDEDDVSSWLSKDVSFEGNAPPRSSGFDVSSVLCL